MYSNSLDRTLFYSNMTVPLCMRQGSKINDDSVSVEELDWSAESQVLIPADHLWCDFKCSPGAKNSSSNTNDLYIHYMDKSTGTPPSLEEKKALPNCDNKDENIICVLKIVFPPLLQQFWSVWNDCTHMLLVFGDEFLSQGLDLKSHQRCSAGIVLGFQ